MKCTLVRITLPRADAMVAAKFRLSNSEDADITSDDQANDYKGPEFIENDSTTKDLHLVLKEGLVMINFLDENDVRVNYTYPVHSVKRIHHILG